MARGRGNASRGNSRAAHRMLPRPGTRPGRAGRARALRIVSEQTGELRHQALHDGLTGLPNRALITDRIDQLLARGRRNGSLGAALYIDLDRSEEPTSEIQ